MIDSFLSSNGAIQIGLLLLAVLALVKPLGIYMSRVYNGRVWLEVLLGPIEDYIYKVLGIDPMREMNWQQYATALIMASFAGFLTLFIILRFQGVWGLNPQQFANLPSDLAFNTAVSFLTNTNWQAYGGEFTLSYFSQMCGLTVQNFLSASMGMAVAIALCRGIARKHTSLIGNFWVDWLRGLLYILLPLSMLLAVLLGTQGVIQNIKPYVVTQLIEPINEEGSPAITTQTIPGGPVASQVAIKQIGSNGGGFFNTNSAHPFENPTPLSNWLEMLAILLIPCAICYTFGVIVNDKRQGWALLMAMTVIFVPLLLFGIQQEQQGNTALNGLPIDQQASTYQSGGNMEGKELRFGIVNSVLWTASTTATSNGSVNSMLDSYTPLGGYIAFAFMMMSEVIYGGVGSGLYGMLIFVFITVFIAGLMVGRTPEYLGKKIQSFEIKMAFIALFVPVISLLAGTSIAIVSQHTQGLTNTGAQGFSEILYAFTSASNNNGSSFGGLSANTLFYNQILGIIMFISRFWIMIPVLAIAGSLAQKPAVAPSSGTLSTHRTLFIWILISVILLIGLLTYMPTLILAPVSEYFQGLT